MSEPKKPPPSNSSRTVAIIAVAVLIVVAIAGIVLAGRKSPAPPETSSATAPTSATTAATSASPGSTPQAAASPTDALPKDVVFAAGSDKLPPGVNEPLARFADAARTSASSIRVSARYLTGANKEKDFELAKARTGAIRHALQANGVTGNKMQVELIEMPAGTLTPDAGNRVDLTLR
jgi:outer membrane protein OmpA-like peptidoglycan-associated protein